MALPPSSAAGDQTAPASRPRSLWRNRDYLLLVGGQVVSVAGSQLSLIAFPLLALFISGSPVQAGLIGSMRLIPYVLFSLPAGALADRWDRKRVMQICDLGRALSLASIPLAFALGHLTILQLYLVSLLEGTLFVFFDLAEVACLPRVVEREQLVEATARNEMARNVAFLLGPALGGIVYAASRFLPFLFDACSYLVSVCSLYWMRVPFQKPRTVQPDKLWREIQAGLLWIWQHPLIFFIAFTGTLFHLLFDGYTLIVIVLAQQMHASPFVIGLILATDGVGSMLGSVLADRFGKHLSLRLTAIACHWLWAACWLLLLIAHSIPLLSLLLLLIFAALTIYDLTQFTYRRALIPDELQGRVNSVFRMISYSGAPLGLALAGLLLQLWGPLVTIALLGGGIVLMALLVTLNPHIRRAGKLQALLSES